MKHRFSSKPKAVSILDGERSRWKRKNREARLRKKIAKQAKEILWLKANLRCIKYIVNAAQAKKGVQIFTPTLEQYTP